MVMEAPPTPQCVGREFVRQYYTLLNKAPAHLHRYVVILWRYLLNKPCAAYIYANMYIMFLFPDSTTTTPHSSTVDWTLQTGKLNLWLDNVRFTRWFSVWTSVTAMPRSVRLTLRLLLVMVSLSRLVSLLHSAMCMSEDQLFWSLYFLLIIH